MNTTNVKVSTKARKDADAIETNLTIDWDGMSPEDVRALAQQALIVKWQGQARTNGIPTEATIKAIDYRVGTRSPKKPTDLAAMLAALPADQRAALLAKFAG